MQPHKHFQACCRMLTLFLTLRWAATDFLLLAQGHGCEDIEGLCCMNLPDRSTSIHQSIQQLQEGVKKLHMGTSWGWFSGLLQSLGPWIQKLIKLGLVHLLIFVCLLICIPCIIFCVGVTINKAINPVLVVQVNDYLGNVDPVSNMLISEDDNILTLVSKKPWQKVAVTVNTFCECFVCRESQP